MSMNISEKVMMKNDVIDAYIFENRHQRLKLSLYENIKGCLQHEEH